MSLFGVEKRLRNWLTSPRRWIALLAAVFVIAIPSRSFGRFYRGFSLLKEVGCKQINAASLANLPSGWHKYTSFIRVCPLQESAYSVARIFIVSIWVNEYFETRFASRPREWEKFPLPIIVDADMVVIGTLPELYPHDDITSSNLFYGKWMSGIPTEIRIDVSNSAEGGDYYYKPLLWNEKSHRYHIVDMEVVDGTRK